MEKYLLMCLLSLVPVSELRGAIPYGYAAGLPLWQVITICTLLNACVPLVGYLFFDIFHKLFYKIKIYKKFYDKTIERAAKKVGPKIEKYGLLGLMFFVAIPLPVTGAWTGFLGAWIFKLNRKKSILFIALGVLIASAIVTTVVLTGSALSKVFIKTF